jgi:site-specific recombinase XerD
MVTLYKRNRIWWIRICLNNKTERHSLGTKDPQLANALRRQREADVMSGGRLKDLTWRDFALEFEQWITPQVRPRTLESYLHAIERLTEHLNGNSLLFLRDLSPGVIAAFIDARRQQLHPSWKRTMSDGGVKHQLRILHRVFAYAVECSYLQKNPVIQRNRNAAPGKTQPFSQEEITKMLTEPYLDDKPYLRAAVMVFLHTGLRISDVIDLRKADVVGERLIIRTRKRGRLVNLSIHPNLRTALDAHLAGQTPCQQTSAFLFSTAAGGRLDELDKNLRRLWKRAGLAGAHAHRFRDTFAVGLLGKGASLYDVAKLLGISVHVAELHYSPYVAELQERGRRLVGMLDFSGAPPPAVEERGTKEATPARWTN